MGIVQKVRALAVLIVAPPLTFVVSLLAWIDLSFVRRSREKALQFPRFWGRTICQLAGVKVILEGIENIDPEATCILAANHCSQFDIFSFQGYYPYHFRWIAKKELFRLPVFGQTMKKAGFISIDRSVGRKALKSLDAAAKQIAGGASVLIFPEGTRSENGTLKEFKTGAIVLAIKAGVPVIPVGFIGSYEVLPKGTFFAESGTITIRFGKPVATEHYVMKDKQQLAESLQQEVEQLLKPEQRSKSTTKAQDL